MPDKNNKFKENVLGKFYVDTDCIACDACCLAAPDHFEIHEDDGHAFVKKQPITKQELEDCQEALDTCPVEAIGSDGE